MSLSQSKLYNAILDIFTKEKVEPTMINFAKELSDAYDEYCQDAMTYAGNQLISAGKSQMRSILETLDAEGNTGAFVASTISSSIVAYWSNCVFAPMPPLPPGFSVVTVVTITPPSTPSASGIQSAIMSGGSDTVQANLWALAIHQQTLSVTTTHIGLDTTLPTPLPKTESNKPIQ